MLTSKRQRFAELVSDGKSLADAYRQAGYKWENMKPAVIRTEASRIMADPAVSLLCERLRGQRERAVVAAAVSDRDLVLSKLRKLLDTTDGGSHVAHQLKAAHLLGQSVGMYKDVTVTEQPTRTAEEVMAEIEQHLSALH